MTQIEIVEMLKAAIVQHGGAVKAARALGISETALHNIKAGRRKAGPKTMTRFGIIVAPKLKTYPTRIQPFAECRLPEGHTRLWNYGDWPSFRRTA